MQTTKKFYFVEVNEANIFRVSQGVGWDDLACPMSEMGDTELLYYIGCRLMVLKLKPPDSYTVAVAEGTTKMEYYREESLTEILKRCRPDFYEKYGVLFPSSISSF